ncbi:LysR family transcriptional regulator [Pseudonocardia sichuanensis]
MDLDAVRTFVAAARSGQFQHAATDLGLTQQAVSKRVAALERELGVPLFHRGARGVALTIDGQAFLPHARELLRAEERAADSVRSGRRALRVDVISRQIAPADLLRGFHAARPDVALDVVTLGQTSVVAAAEAVAAGTIDASFRAVAAPLRALPDGVTATRVLDEPHDLLCGPRHPHAGRVAVTLAQLVGHRLWIPGAVAGTEWATYYQDLAAAFGLGIETVGPSSGTEHLLDVLAESPTVATLVGSRTRMLWPDHYDLRRIPVCEPRPIYPHSLVWRRDNPHPGLRALREHLGRAVRLDASSWEPTWAR